MEGQNCDSQDRTSIAAPRGNNNHLGTVSVHFTRASVFYDIQWKRIRGIPFILKSHNNNRQQIKMHILNQAQVNLIYNTNRNLFLWIEIFISTTDLYNTTADRWSCHLPKKNKKIAFVRQKSVDLSNF